MAAKSKSQLFMQTRRTQTSSESRALLTLSLGNNTMVASPNRSPTASPKLGIVTRYRCGFPGCNKRYASTDGEPGPTPPSAPRRRSARGGCDLPPIGAGSSGGRAARRGAGGRAPGACPPPPPLRPPAPHRPVQLAPAALCARGLTCLPP